MKKYLLYIKSHNESDDYEDKTEAIDIDEAADNFLRQMPSEAIEEWDRSTLKNYIGEYED